ncbi:MAG: FlaA1/EpsC-like NDP-sugar epimerase, partial [Parvicellaceae bacterium]
MRKKALVATYIFLDFVSASSVWVLFYFFRKKYIEAVEFVPDEKLYLGLSLIPFFWVILYAATGSYNNVYRKYRLKEFGQTLFISILGTLFLFFFLILDDEMGALDGAESYKNYYRSVLALFSLHFVITVTLRLIITTRTVKKIHRREIGFNTLIVGGNERAMQVYQEIEAIKNSPGYKFVGFVSTNGVDRALLKTPLEYFGKYEDLEKTIIDNEIEEVIIAIESSEHKYLKKIIDDLEKFNVKVKIIPDMYDILTGQVKMNSIFGAPLIQVNQQIMPAWQITIKRLMDILMSFFALIL